jgi:hypothetical protein
MLRTKDEKRNEIKVLDSIGFDIQEKCDEVNYDIDRNVYYTEFNKILYEYEFSELNSIREKYLAQKLGACLFYLMKDMKLKKIKI